MNKPAVKWRYQGTLTDAWTLSANGCQGTCYVNGGELSMSEYGRYIFATEPTVQMPEVEAQRRWLNRATEGHIQ